MKSQVTASSCTQSLQLLVSELIKKEPDRRRIRELAQKTGVDYMEDPIEMMSLVLKSIDSVTAREIKRLWSRQGLRLGKAHETSL